MAVFRPRPWYFIVALCCAALLAYALYVQHVDFLDPCPLCILQRVAFLWIGVLALVASARDEGFAVADDGSVSIRAANSVPFGLSSSIFTQDVNRAFRAMRDFETGIVYVNAGTTGAERSSSRWA